jgi:hypothetical protein
MRHRSSFYGIEARVLGMLYRRNVIYLSTLKGMAKAMGGKVPKDYRDMVMQHARDAADLVTYEAS